MGLHLWPAQGCQQVLDWGHLGGHMLPVASMEYWGGRPFLGLLVPAGLGGVAMGTRLLGPCLLTLWGLVGGPRWQSWVPALELFEQRPEQATGPEFRGFLGGEPRGTPSPGALGWVIPAASTRRRGCATQGLEEQ